MVDDNVIHRNILILIIMLVNKCCISRLESSLECRVCFPLRCNEDTMSNIIFTKPGHSCINVFVKHIFNPSFCHCTVASIPLPKCSPNGWTNLSQIIFSSSTLPIAVLGVRQPLTTCDRRTSQLNLRNYNLPAIILK